MRNFSSYDPDNFNNYESTVDSYDPDFYDASSAMENATGTAPSRPMAPRAGFRALSGQGQLDITITTNMTTASTGGSVYQTKIELFNPLRSFAYVDNANVLPTTLSKVSGLRNADFANDTARQNKITFDGDGSLWVYGVVSSTVLEYIKITCRQIPYKALLESAKVSPFMVNKMRLTVDSNDLTQIDNEFTHVAYTFLGAVKRNPISPRSFFRPDQQQSNIVDIKATFAIDGEKGLEYAVNNSSANTTVRKHTISLFIPIFQKPTNANSF
jgi:hypothetical protein